MVFERLIAGQLPYIYAVECDIGYGNMVALCVKADVGRATGDMDI